MIADARSRQEAVDSEALQDYWDALKGVNNELRRAEADNDLATRGPLSVERDRLLEEIRRVRGTKGSGD